MGPDLRRGTPDPCTYGSEAPKRACRFPRVSPRSLRVRSGPWQGPGTRRTPTWVGVRWRHMSRLCLTLPAQAETRCCRVACGPWHKPTDRVWRKAHTAVQPLHLLRRGRAACHHADGRRALSAFNAPCPICWQTASGSSSRRRAWPVCWRTVHPCRAAHCTHHPFYKKLPLHAEDMQISGVRTQEDCPDSKHLWPQVLYSLCPWAHMSGFSTFVHAPLQL
jgi:hypothetical protein